MIELEITINVDGVKYGVDKRMASMPGQNNTPAALRFLEKEVARMKRALESNLEN